MMPDVQIPSLDGSFFTGYAATPPGGNGPGLLVIHEIFGLCDALRAQCDAFAARGYIALCPDLFWRTREKDKPEKETDWDEAARLYKSFDIEAGLRDLLASLAFLRQTPGCGGKVGAIGACLGGRLAFLLASRSDIDCGIGYYGVGLDSHLDEVHDIRVPFMLHLGEMDKLLPAPVQKKVLRSLARNPLIEVHTYPGADHGFARVAGTAFHPAAAALAEKRSYDLLAKVLLD